MTAETEPGTEALDAILVALWQCETERGFEHMAAKVHARFAEARRSAGEQIAQAIEVRCDRGCACESCDPFRTAAHIVREVTA